MPAFNIIAHKKTNGIETVFPVRKITVKDITAYIFRDMRIECNQEDTLELGKNVKIRDLGIHSVICSDELIQSHGKNGSLYCKAVEYIPGFEGEAETYIGVECYRTGYTLSVHSPMQGDGHLKQLGIYKASFTNSDSCRTWPTKSALLHFIKARESLLRAYHIHGDWTFCMSYVNERFRADEEKRCISLTARQKEREDEISGQIADMLNKINESSSAPEIPASIPEDADARKILIEKELRYRMQKLGLHQKAVEDFLEKGKVLMSDTNGKIRKLDEESVRGIDKVREYGHIPYHVIRYYMPLIQNYTHDVLYISCDETDDWQYERPDNNGQMDIYSFGEFDEHGPIIVRRSSSGGLIRIH